MLIPAFAMLDRASRAAVRQIGAVYLLVWPFPDKTTAAAMIARQRANLLRRPSWELRDDLKKCKCRTGRINGEYVANCPHAGSPTTEAAAVAR